MLTGEEHDKDILREIPSDGVPKWPTADPADTSLRQLQEILLGYLRHANYPAWPGADGLMLEDAINAYPRAAALGLVPTLARIRELHPDLVQALPHLFPQKPRSEP
jgi:hypothetical protein